MTTISNALQAVQRRVVAATAACGRAPGSVQLLAVSKTFGPDAIRAAYHAGQRLFGESYVQEALPKMEALRDLAIEWHFIGPIQSNKTHSIAAHFAWAHSVDREKIARRLSDQRPTGMGPLSVCLQVNVSGEASKQGVAPGNALALGKVIAELPGLRLRGLMAIPAPSDDVAHQRTQFRQLRELCDEFAGAGLGLDTLSMGMSADLESAIAEGANIVRVGSAIFGVRDKNVGHEVVF